MNATKPCILGLLAVILVVFILYQYDPSFFGQLGGKREGFEDGVDTAMADSHASQKRGEVNQSPGEATTRLNKSNKHRARGREGFEGDEDYDEEKQTSEAFADLSAYEGPAEFASVSPPAGCYPRDQLTPSELLPTDQNSTWAQQNPMGPGSLKGKNYLSAGALIGVNTVGQSLRNSNLQLRSETPNPQIPVSIFSQSTIAPDMNRRPLEIGA